jgi:sugar phosphate isomerase/epimerase
MNRSDPILAAPLCTGALNLCTSTLPTFALDDALRLAAGAGYDGVELRVHDAYHVSLPELQRRCDEIKRSVDAHELQLRVYNTYFGVNDVDSADALIEICRRTGVKHFRVTLPVAGVADVRNLGTKQAVVPSYRERAPAADVLKVVRSAVQRLAKRTKAAGVGALLEIHWGTVMSSFTSAYHLVRDLDPEAVAITFDPANMIIEGKEDWDYGIELLRPYIANVHIKNVSWTRDAGIWKWQWDGLQQGMVDWPQVFGLLGAAGYRGMLAMEDFRVPHHFTDALDHLQALRHEASLLLQQSSSRQAA